jgi:GNAT superfamily N-acetyltransferase
MPDRPLTFCAYSRNDILAGQAEHDLKWLHSHFSSEGMSDRIQEKHLDELVIAKDERGTIVWFYGLKLPHESHLATIETMGVNPKLRNRGFGRKALLAAVRACISVGKTRIWITPHGNNSEFKKMQSAIEWKEVPKLINHPNGPFVELFTVRPEFVKKAQDALKREMSLPKLGARAKRLPIRPSVQRKLLLARNPGKK